MSHRIQRPCIYCNNVRPFTDEHMFPKGLGGDDGRFILKEMVCGYCNTDVFSKLETSFMRNSPVAIARIFMQKVKGSGTDAIIPKFDTKSTTLMTPEWGEVEAEMRAHGIAVVLPQLLFLGDGKCGLISGDEPGISSFLADLRRQLTGELLLIRKIQKPDGTFFEITVYEYKDGRYMAESVSTGRRPPIKGIWAERFPVLTGTSPSSRHPTLYKRTAGQITVRVGEEADVANLLTTARMVIESGTATSTPKASTIENPSMLFSMSMDIDAYSRVLAKIGLNLVAYSFGEDYIRHPAFDIAKAAILGHRQDGLRFQSSDLNETLKFAFSGVPHDRHAMTLVPFRTSQDTCNVAMLLRLFGSITYAVHLGTDAPPPPRPLPQFHVIDYNAHRIEELDALNFFRKYPPGTTAGSANGTA